MDKSILKKFLMWWRFEVRFEYYPKAILRKWRWWFFHKKLNWVAGFIEKQKLYPVTLDENLLKVWKEKERLFRKIR